MRINLTKKDLINQIYMQIGFSKQISENLINDFDLVPVIPGLDETIVINNNVFRTTDKKATNIIFKEANIT